MPKTSSELDPAKLKVVELRAELQTRGLDTKGNKPVLVKRLKEALEAELQQDLPDTSIADTSTEDINTSQEVESDKEESKRESSPEPEPEPEPSKEPEPEPEVQKVKEVTPPKEKESTKKVEESPKEVESDTPEEGSEPTKDDEDVESTENIEENGTNGDTVDEDSSEPKNRKSRWGTTESKVAEPAEEEPEPMEQQEQPAEEEEVEKSGSEAEPRGEKRKHSSPSPERPQQRRRSKSPQGEEEPTIDSSKVQLSWYDSDLHLQIDKETFLSAKPLHDGAFGYIWSGARLSHGFKTGKVCYEVKVAEEMKFEDILKLPVRDRKDRGRDKKDKGNRFDRDRNKNRYEGKSDECEPRDESKEENWDEEMAEAEKAEANDTQAEPSAKDEAKEADPPAEGEAKEDVQKMAVDDEPDEDKNEPDEKTVTKMEEETKTDDDVKTEDDVKTVGDVKAEGDVKTEDDTKSEDEIKAEDDKKTEDDEKSEDKKAEDDKKTDKDDTKQEDEHHNIPSHLIRIGWSVATSNLQLGESEFSFGLESSGKLYVNKEFTENEEAKFGVNDTVCAYLDMDGEEITMSFAINGEIKASTKVDRADVGEDFTLFPHVITRNYSFELNVGNLEERWAPAPEEFADFVFVNNVEDKVAGAIAPEKRDECEVIMMCGLPAAGKTHWVKEHLETTTDKNYTIIGNTYILERMTVDGRPIEEKINKGRWNVVLDKLTKCLNKLCEVASSRRRNFILDQTNVFPSAQRRKMRSFWGFKRHAVIVVNEDEEQARRLKQQESQTGKDLPESAVFEMKANMSVPRVGEWLEKVTFASLPEAEAKAQVQKYNLHGREAGFGNMHHRRDYRDDRGYNNRWGTSGPRREYRGSNYRDNRPYNRYPDRGHRQGGGNWRAGSGGGGGWGMRNDRRDNRGPRDWRSNRGGMNDRHRGGGGGGGGNRDHRNHAGTGGSFNRNRNQASVNAGRSSGGWGNQAGNWGGQGQGGGWNNQGQGQNNWGGQGWNQGQGSWNQNQWKYGGGYGQGGYGQYASWNYYGQYAQNWNAQNQSGQAASTTAGTASSNTASDSSTQQYAQMTPQQQQAAWAQYAQQYAQSTAPATTPTQK